jgi:hypothetical protein
MVKLSVTVRSTGVEENTPIIFKEYGHLKFSVGWN